VFISGKPFLPIRENPRSSAVSSFFPIPAMSAITRDFGDLARFLALSGLFYPCSSVVRFCCKEKGPHERCGPHIEEMKMYWKNQRKGFLFPEIFCLSIHSSAYILLTSLLLCFSIAAYESQILPSICRNL
jgi:hypothetical protein